jgi:hypothetical protein
MRSARAWRYAIAASLTGILLGARWGGAAAQDPPRVGLDAASFDSLRSRHMGFTPLHGPVGTRVTLKAADMPSQAPLRIGVGALRMGFEEVGWVLSSVSGELEFDLEIPGWATNDAPIFLIVFDPYFAPIAVSTAFHVTGPDGTVVRTGEVAVEGSCISLIGQDGGVYELAGDMPRLQPGSQVTVEATLGDRNQCGKDTALIVRGITVQ